MVGGCRYCLVTHRLSEIYTILTILTCLLLPGESHLIPSRGCPSTHSINPTQGRNIFTSALPQDYAHKRPNVFHYSQHTAGTPASTCQPPRKRPDHSSSRPCYRRCRASHEPYCSLDALYEPASKLEQGGAKTRTADGTHWRS